jgi:hypothetical protein
MAAESPGRGPVVLPQPTERDYGVDNGNRDLQKLLELSLSATLNQPFFFGEGAGNLPGSTSWERSQAGVRPAGAPLGCGRSGGPARAARSKRAAGSQFPKMWGYPGSKKSTPKIAMDHGPKAAEV